MKPIKMILIGCLVFTFCTEGVYALQSRTTQTPTPQAQPPSQPAGIPGGAMRLQGKDYLMLLQKRLELTKQQALQIQAMQAKMDQQQQAIVQKSQGQQDPQSRDDARVEMAKLQKSFDLELAKILKKDQLQAYQKLQAELQDPDAQYVALLAVRLNLSDEQAGQVRALLKEQTQQQQGQLQKKPGEQVLQQPDQKGREINAADIQKQQAALNAKIEKLLTNEQQQLYQQLLKEQQQMRPPRM